MANIEPQADPTKDVLLEKEPTPAEIERDAALALIVQDYESANAWIAGQQWQERWNEIDILYDSPRVFKTWEQNTVTQPNVQRYIISRHVNSIHPAMQEGLFQETPPFIAMPRPGYTMDAAIARAAVLNYQLEDMEFETEVSNGLFQDILHGTAIWKWGMSWQEVTDYSYQRQEQPIRQVGPTGESIVVHTAESDTFTEKPKVTRQLLPWFENREIRSVLVDPGLRLPDIRKAKFVIDQSYVNLADLLEMKKDPDYDLPSEEEMRSWFERPKESPETAGILESNTTGSPSIAGQGEPGWMETTQDPSLQGLLMLERWDKYKVITAINNKIVIRNRENPYGVIPFYSCNWFNRIRAFWGLGVGKIVAQDQRLSQGLTNGGLALLQLMLDPPFVVNDDENIATQNQRFRKGGFIKVKTTPNRDVSRSVVPLEMPRLPIGEVMTFLQNSEAEGEAGTGANALTMQGSITGPKSSITRTKGGSDTFAGASATRLQGPLDKFINQVFIPWIYQLDSLNVRFLPMQQVRDIVGERLGKVYELDEQSFKSAKVKYTALASTRMAAKRIMAQSLPILSQILLNPQISEQLKIQGKYINLLELVKAFLQTAGWPNQDDWIKDLTPEMQQNMDAMNPGIQKAQAQSAADDKRFSQQQALLAQKTEGGIARDAISKALEQGTGEVLRKAVVDSSNGTQ